MPFILYLKREIGGSKEKTNHEIIACILKELGKGQSLIKHVTDRKGHDRRYSMDSSKITRELGWMPTVSFKKTIEWYR
ncbi:GDP-mannose 4,6-dehydratase [Peribacillus sp. NPDC094092]|uniref:GDP-mannose 4,6-dehydratase n=1 Tax=Peribacillus sp. NPDC094092 TaxID=3390611 RepID=UPI003CFD0A6D